MRLNKQHEQIVLALQKKNEEQGRMIVAYNQERLARLQADTEAQPQSIALPDEPTTEITLPDKPSTAIAQLETTDQQTHKDKGEDELFIKGTFGTLVKLSRHM